MIVKKNEDNEAATLWNKGISLETASEFVTKKHQENLAREKEDRRLSLLEIISKQENNFSFNEDIPLHSKQMWNGNEWVPLCLSKAHQRIKADPDYELVLRMYSQCTNQPEFGEVLNGWRKIDSEYLRDALGRLSDLDSVNCSCCSPKYSTREVLEGDIKAQEQRDPWFRNKQMRRA